MHTQTRIDAATLRRLAVEADADPRTVKRELTSPGSVRGMTGDRIRRAIAGSLAGDAVAVEAAHD